MDAATQISAKSVTGKLNFTGVLEQHGSEIHLNPDKS